MTFKARRRRPPWQRPSAWAARLQILKLGFTRMD